MARKYSSVDEYIEAAPVESRLGLNRIRELIMEVVPGAEETFTYNVPAFSLIEGGGMEEQIMMAGYKKHVGFYPHPTTMTHFSEELKEYKCGKGSVQFPIGKPLPEELISEMIQYRKDLIDNKIQFTE